MHPCASFLCREANLLDAQRSTVAAFPQIPVTYRHYPAKTVHSYYLGIIKPYAGVLAANQERADDGRDAYDCDHPWIHRAPLGGFREATYRTLFQKSIIDPHDARAAYKRPTMISRGLWSRSACCSS